jgi:hypothetical protein
MKIEIPVVERLDRVSSAEDESQLEELDSIIQSLTPSECGVPEFEALLRIFERFPESDGFGIFWSIVHFLEGCTGYEPSLLSSVRRAPADFNVMMIHRQLNGGIAEIDGISLLEVLRLVSESESVLPCVKLDATRYLERQKKT